MTAFLLAAGLGTRLRPLTLHWPKPAIQFLNVPLIEWSWSFIQSQRPTRLIVNRHYLPEGLNSCLTRLRQDVEVLTSEEVAAPLGSGGALWNAKALIGSDSTLLIGNADEVILPLQPGAVDRLIKRHHNEDALATLLVMRHPLAGTHFGGVWVEPGSLEIEGFGRTKLDGCEAWHYVGVIAVSSRIFNYLPDGESNLLYDAVMRGLHAGEKALIHSEELFWRETGDPESFFQASADALALICASGEATDSHAFAAAHGREVLRRHSQSYLWQFGSSHSLVHESMVDVVRSLRQQVSSSELGLQVIGAGVKYEEPVRDVIALPGSSVTKSTSPRSITVP
ncbi:MAG TPA: sugar phosphate nucleotidyltransferase [Pseudobdellovibrionaceae bacterium]|nr:sugar phosphate nucleotidyltransferase [Pseudobdellovibrionaceae bacterium]